MGSQYMDSMMGRERLGSGGGQNEIMGNKNSPQQMHHKQMKGSQNMHHGNNNYHHNHHNQGGRLHGPGNHSNFGRGGMSGGNYSQQGSYYPSSHGPQHNSYQNQQHNAPNYYNNSPQGHGGVYHNNRPNSFGANHSSNNGMKLVPNSFPRPHVGGNTGVNMGNNQDYPGNILPPSAYYARNKTFSSTTTTSVGNFRNVNNNHGNSNAFHSGGQDSLSGLGGLSNNDSFGLQSQRGGGYNNQNNGLRGGGGNFQQHGIFDMSSSSLGSSILPPSNPLGFRSTTTSTLSTNSSNTSLSSNHDPAIRRQDLWFDGF